MASFMCVQTSSPEATQAVGRALGGMLRAGDVVLLSGSLGAGKTCLTQGVAWGLGVREHARSPTFVLANEYAGRLPVFHLDLYRIEGADEALDMGLDEYLNGDAVTIIEWAEKAQDAMPREHLLVELKHRDLGTQRALRFTARGRRYRTVLDRLLAVLTREGTGDVTA